MLDCNVIDDMRCYSINDLVDMGYGSRTSIWRIMNRDHDFPAVKLPNGRIVIPRYKLREYLESKSMGNMLDSYDCKELGV